MESPTKTDTTRTTDQAKAKQQIAQVKEKILHSDGFFFTLLRSSVSSQLCGWIDTITAFLVFSLAHLTPFLSTAIGAFVGGVFNCIINYRFTFHAYGVQWRIALVKFLFVWAGSLLLNSFGTQIVYSWVHDWHWLEHNPWISKDGIFLAVRLSVALAISLGWNFLLQRNFVFKEIWIDKHIGRMLDWMGIGVQKSREEDEEATEC